MRSDDQVSGRWSMRLFHVLAIVCLSLSMACTRATHADDLAATARDSISPSQQARASERTVGVPGATTILVRFDAAEMDPQARILLIAENGDRQTFDKPTLLQWQQHSAPFNGSRVRIRVEAPVGASANYAATALGIDLKSTSSSVPGKIFGTDHRVSVNDPRVGRIVIYGPGGQYCSGWLTAIGAVLTAGHCDFTGAPLVLIQFNVPPSRGDGVPQNPPAADMYPLKSVAKDYVVGVPGRDWQIASISPNSNGQSAFDRQKATFRLSNQVPAVPPPLPAPPLLLQVTGYGRDDQPKGLDNDVNAQSQTEQTDVGPMKSTSVTPAAACIDYVLDADTGNSGGPVFLPGTGIAMAIHARSTDCQGGGTANSGTLLALPALGQALARFPTGGANVVFVDGQNPNAAVGDGTVFTPFQRLSDAVAFNGGQCPAATPVISVVAGHYEGYAFKETNTCPFKIIAPSGSVLIGPRPIPRRNP